MQTVMGSWLQSLHITPPPPLFGADISTPRAYPSHPGSHAHTACLAESPMLARTHPVLFLPCTSPHMGCCPSTKVPQSEADLKQRGGRPRRSQPPPRSRRPALLRLLPAGSCGSSESWPWPSRERNCFHSSERAERSFHLPQIKLQPGDISKQDPNRELETGSPPINSQDLQPFLDWLIREKLGSNSV